MSIFLTVRVIYLSLLSPVYISKRPCRERNLYRKSMDIVLLFRESFGRGDKTFFLVLFNFYGGFVDNTYLETTPNPKGIVISISNFRQKLLVYISYDFVLFVFLAVQPL